MTENSIRLTMSEEDKESAGGFVHQFSVRETYPLHCHTFFELFLVSKGKAVHCINGASQLLTEGSFVLIRPDDIHKYEFFNQYDFELINISFQREVFEDACRIDLCSPSFFTNPEVSPHIILDGYNFTDVKRKLLHFDRKEPGFARKRYLHSLLPFFLYRFLAEPEIIHPNTYIPSWMTDLLQEMDCSDNFVTGLPRLLELANMSQEHLTREFRKYLNITPTEYINARRMNYAIKLLLETDSEIIDICHECGFNNLSHFYRNFHKQFECSPKKFLERYLSES